MLDVRKSLLEDMSSEETPRPVGWLLIILGIGLAIRLATLVSLTSYFPDELFQYLEVAHHKAFGYGTLTWEQRELIRSPIFPLLLSLPMKVGSWIAPSGLIFLYFTKAMLACASLATIWGSYAIGRILSPLHGLFAAFVAAIWFEFVYFSTQALTEAFAIGLFLPAAALLLDTARATPRRLILAGFLLSAAAILRFQYGPALLLFGMMTCGRNLTNWFFASAGALIAVMASSAVDLAHGLVPFQWVLTNYSQNIVEGRSLLWTEGPVFYPLALMSVLLPFVPIMLLVGWPAFKRFPALACVAVVNIGAHSLVAHKEYRYILLSSALLVLLAALGSVDLLIRQQGHSLSRRALVYLGISWMGASLFCATNGPNRAIWTRFNPELSAFQHVQADHSACGLAVIRHRWTAQGGYTYFHHPRPIYVMSDDATSEQISRASPAFNYAIIDKKPGLNLPTNFQRISCSEPKPEGEAFCLYKRPGNCRPGAAAEHEMNRFLRDNNL